VRVTVQEEIVSPVRYSLGMPRIRKSTSLAERALDAVVSALPLVHHLYRDFDDDGLVLPNKPYSLELPAAAAGAIAVHVAVIPHESHASERFRAREAVVVDGRLRLELEGSGVVNGVSVLFVLN
jgi:hypothetical protein